MSEQDCPHQKFNRTYVIIDQHVYIIFANKLPIQLLTQAVSRICLPHEPSFMALRISYPVAYL